MERGFSGTEMSNSSMPAGVRPFFCVWYATAMMFPEVSSELERMCACGRSVCTTTLGLRGSDTSTAVKFFGALSWASHRMRRPSGAIWIDMPSPMPPKPSSRWWLSSLKFQVTGPPLLCGADALAAGADLFAAGFLAAAFFGAAFFAGFLATAFLAAFLTVFFATFFLAAFISFTLHALKIGGTFSAFRWGRRGGGCRFVGRVRRALSCAP